MNLTETAHKVVIVTGAGSGIGKSIAKLYSENGIYVICSDINPEAGEKTVKEIRQNHGKAAFYEADLYQSIQIKQLIQFSLDTFGKLDGIVNNAGIGHGGFPLHEYDVNDYDRVIDINLKSVFVAMKYGAESILKSSTKGGFIINIASIAGTTAQSGQSIYSASKHGVIGMTKSAAIEYAPYNLTVNAICPGFIQTPIYGDAPEAAMDIFNKLCPTGHMGKPEDCANLALFLASDKARYITGTAIPVDGGLSAGMTNLMQWKNPEIIAH